MVIDQPDKVEGGVVAPRSSTAEQRLTTAQVLIAAAARMCEDAGHPKHASRLRRLWLQDEDMELAGEERLKLRPSRDDRKAFSDIMDPDNPSLDGSGTALAAHQFFADRLAEWFNELPSGTEDEYFDALRDTIYEHLLFVLIELQPGDNPREFSSPSTHKVSDCLRLIWSRITSSAELSVSPISISRFSTRMSFASVKNGGERTSSRAAIAAHALNYF